MLVSGIRDFASDEVRRTGVAFVRAARVVHVPVMRTSTAPMMWGPTLPELEEALPGQTASSEACVNAWDEPEVPTLPGVPPQA